MYIIYVHTRYPFIAKQMLESPSPEMITLLQAVLVNPTTRRIRWDKLEEFLSISANANAAVAGDFSALQSAQNRADLVKVYSNQRVEGNFTMEVTLQIMDFLLSEKGSFLLIPLVDEIVDTIDDLGLTLQALVSLNTFGVIPAPNEKPNRSRVERFLRLLEMALAGADRRVRKDFGLASLSSPGEDKDNNNNKRNVLRLLVMYYLNNVILLYISFKHCYLL